MAINDVLMAAQLVEMKSQRQQDLHHKKEEQMDVGKRRSLCSSIRRKTKEVAAEATTASNELLAAQLVETKSKR